VVLPLSKEISAKGVYTKISEALVNGLRLYSNLLNDVELESVQPNFSEIHKQPDGMLCFASTAKSEIKYKGKKLIGSAQRKMGNFLLQHGSILCGSYHRNLVNYLKNLSDYNRKLMKNEFVAKTIEIDEITGEKVNDEKLINCLTEGFKREWNIEFNNVYCE